MASLADSVTRQRRREQARRLWLRQHGRLEKTFADSLRAFFRSQAHRAAAAIRDAGHVAVALLLDWQQEHAALMRIVERGLLGAMLTGADRELSAVQKSKAADDWAVDGLADTTLDTPPAVMQRIREALDESTSATDWANVTRETQTRIGRIVADGIDDGASQREISRAINDELGGLAESRALRIARTETTAGLNSGHHAARQELIADRLITTVEWVAVQDAATRETHSELDGTEVAAGQPFNVGSHETPYPGHWSLPAAERVHCRCVAISGAVFSDNPED